MQSAWKQLMGGVEKRLQLLKRGSNWRLTHPPDDKAATCAVLISRLEAKIIHKITLLSDKFANELEITLPFSSSNIYYEMLLFYYDFLILCLGTVLDYRSCPPSRWRYFCCTDILFEIVLQLLLPWCGPFGMIPNIAYIWSQCVHHTYIVYYI